MRKLTRVLAWAVGAVVALSVVAAGFVFIRSEQVVRRRWTPRPESVRAAAEPARRSEGERLGKVLGCTHCHGDDLRGRLFFDEPQVGRLYAPNLTLAAQHGSDEGLAQAIRQGICSDGRGALAMPSSMFAALDEHEMAALLGYLRAQPAGGQPTPPIEIRFMGRLGVATGQFKPAPATLEEARLKQPPDLGPQHAAGRHLARIACSECHGSDLGGVPGFGDMGPIPDLRVASGYPAETFRKFMRTGEAVGGRELKLMSEASRVRFAHLTDAEIDALHGYLVALAESGPPVEPPKH